MEAQTYRNRFINEVIENGYIEAESKVTGCKYMMVIQPSLQDTINRMMDWDIENEAKKKHNKSL